ncbi:hypothetical protein TgHK011_004235 [Trichoderma gracile]|nr:hypothetical protein TgHK011_004235 [Trichoderma gracile]
MGWLLQEPGQGSNPCRGVPCFDMAPGAEPPTSVEKVERVIMLRASGLFFARTRRTPAVFSSITRPRFQSVSGEQTEDNPQGTYSGKIAALRQSYILFFRQGWRPPSQVSPHTFMDNDSKLNIISQHLGGNWHLTASKPDKEESPQRHRLIHSMRLAWVQPDRPLPCYLAAAQTVLLFLQQSTCYCTELTSVHAASFLVSTSLIKTTIHAKRRLGTRETVDLGVFRSLGRPYSEHGLWDHGMGAGVSGVGITARTYVRDEYAVQHDGFCKGSWMVWPCWGILPSKGRGGAWTTATDRPVRASHLQTFKSPYGQARPAWQRKMDASRWRSAATAMRGRLQTLHRIALVYEGNGHGKIQVSMTGQRWLAGLDGRLSRDPAEDVPLAESVHVEGQTRGISRSFTRIGLLCLRRPRSTFCGLPPLPDTRLASCVPLRATLRRRHSTQPPQGGCAVNALWPAVGTMPTELDNVEGSCRRAECVACSILFRPITVGREKGTEDELQSSGDRLAAAAFTSITRLTAVPSQRQGPALSCSARVRSSVLRASPSFFFSSEAIVDSNLAQRCSLSLRPFATPDSSLLLSCIPGVSVLSRAELRPAASHRTVRYRSSIDFAQLSPSLFLPRMIGPGSYPLVGSDIDSPSPRPGLFRSPLFFAVDFFAFRFLFLLSVSSRRFRRAIDGGRDKSQNQRETASRRAMTTTVESTTAKPTLPISPASSAAMGSARDGSGASPEDSGQARTFKAENEAPPREEAQKRPGDDQHEVSSNSEEPTRKRRRSRKGLEKRFECNAEGCGKSYSRAEHLYRHQLNHNSKQIFRCEYPDCPRTFVRGDLLKRHMDRHTAKGSQLNRRDSMCQCRCQGPDPELELDLELEPGLELELPPGLHLHLHITTPGRPHQSIITTPLPKSLLVTPIR